MFERWSQQRWIDMGMGEWVLLRRPLPSLWVTGHMGLLHHWHSPLSMWGLFAHHHLPKHPTNGSLLTELMDDFRVYLTWPLNMWHLRPSSWNFLLSQPPWHKSIVGNLHLWSLFPRLIIELSSSVCLINLGTLDTLLRIFVSCTITSNHYW